MLPRRQFEPNSIYFNMRWLPLEAHYFQIASLFQAKITNDLKRYPGDISTSINLSREADYSFWMQRMAQTNLQEWCRRVVIEPIIFKLHDGEPREIERTILGPEMRYTRDFSNTS